MRIIAALEAVPILLMLSVAPCVVPRVNLILAISLPKAFLSRLPFMETWITDKILCSAALPFRVLVPCNNASAHDGPHLLGQVCVHMSSNSVCWELSAT